MIQNYQLTEYPKLYVNYYWGGFEYQKENVYNMDETIFKNRNSFVKKYKIKINKNARYHHPAYVEKNVSYKLDYFLFDHVEIYETYDKKFIILISPYTVTDESAERLKKNKWKKIDNMYTLNSESFIKIIAKKSGHK